MRRRALNCSLADGEIPLSGDFFRAIHSEVWIFILPAAMTLAILVLFLEEVGFFLRNVGQRERWQLSLWILGIYPVFAVTSLIGLYIPRSASLCSFVASIYHSITLWKFLGLITDFFGGKGRMLEQLAGEEVSPSPFPCCCCCCCAMISVSRLSLRWMTVAVFQLSVVRTVLFFVMLVLWTDEKYDYGEVDFLSPNSYMHIIIGASTFLSFYGYLLFYKATKGSLPGYGLQGKFICVTVVLVLFGLQSGILETVGALGAISCSPPFSIDMRSQIIFNYAVIVEMFFISILARFCFRKVEPGNIPIPCRPRENKSVQTEEAGSSGAPEPDRLSVGAGADEALCRIEYAPLDGFDFQGSAGRLGRGDFGPGRADFAPGPPPAQDPALPGPHATRVKAQVDARDPKQGVTLV
ncbi:organic solute transporter subunit alpha [Pristis pectinata]|uniref:organic solute transporter subunit alpha n=1 Tax=Pristis pectinata TaxID=685728 RepID=UPI00223C9681|nr:organic solute transporter subunit alpha [Pristis pectinata]